MAGRSLPAVGVEPQHPQDGHDQAHNEDDRHQRLSQPAQRRAEDRGHHDDDQRRAEDVLGAGTA